MTIKSKIAGTLLAVLTVAAPLALSASPADAAPSYNGMMSVRRDDNNGRGHADMYRDRNHRPPMKVEYRLRQPHGHYHWRNGGWNWSHNRWAWAPGVWVRF